jgi:hypothetical protein
VVIDAVEHADVRLVLKPLRRHGGRCVETGGNYRIQHQTTG